ncbi:hypothetical protein BU24DRAFT_433773 [Aaosphaeria arxii CBS 175.79]|uniref:N-acetyltransferase domain-containing protein n=1 Tax=Aaosphaeria arxii CBS 175.79 TaxID=1450172 RepID=A0A6A5XN70_9PLEO|nr:uncharacterized protein BU24DRAFT_433773 [Aaosphaeria arxii CBS 175.79]KAF2014373.1 hypothetical protein BU24DRAFT_433773 [Aaosphaeria arxii CBS 175.79]
MASKYVVKQAQTKEELYAIMDVIWAANYTPYEPIVQIVFPVLGYQPADREASVVESKERFWKNHENDPSSNWFYVQEIASGHVVGSAQWQIFKDNPFPKDTAPLTAPWWPEGEHREYCESILNQIYKPRVSWMKRPHLALNWMAVHPSHRRCGVATMLMEVGVSHADFLNVEAWMESSEMGKPLYENHGFRPLFKIDFDTHKKDPGDIWRKCEYEMRVKPLFPMWRPKQGDWEEKGGRPGIQMPWELGEQGNSRTLGMEKAPEISVASLPPAGALAAV